MRKKQILTLLLALPVGLTLWSMVIRAGVSIETDVMVATADSINKEAVMRVSSGKKFFNTFCAGCHNADKQHKIPSLACVTQKHDREWLVKWTQDSQALVRSGDKAANKVYHEYGIRMNAAHFLSPDEINMIFDFIEYQDKELDRCK